eukprot:6180488-Pleurochrysis_carterae.AAC.3
MTRANMPIPPTGTTPTQVRAIRGVRIRSRRKINSFYHIPAAIGESVSCRLILRVTAGRAGSRCRWFLRSVTYLLRLCFGPDVALYKLYELGWRIRAAVVSAAPPHAPRQRSEPVALRQRWRRYLAGVHIISVP